ncbi:MAG: spermidine synthase [Cognaticolwellia sp.]
MKLTQHVNQGRLVYLSNTTDQITISENEHYRWLAFDDVIQSVMHLRCPEKLTLPHHYAALMPLLFFQPNQVIELGLGGGNLSRFLSALNPKIQVMSIELSQAVIDCFKGYFNPQQHQIVIKNSEALTWLQQTHCPKRTTADWLICDVYQHYAKSFQSRVNLLTALIDNLQNNACLTINLPDLDDQEINLCLTILRQLQSSHHIIYFHIPRYLNVIIHLLPKHWMLDNLKKRSKTSYLPPTQYLRWRKFFSYHMSAI